MEDIWEVKLLILVMDYLGIKMLKQIHSSIKPLILSSIGLAIFILVIFIPTKNVTKIDILLGILFFGLMAIVSITYRIKPIYEYDSIKLISYRLFSNPKEYFWKDVKMVSSIASITIINFNGKVVQVTAFHTNYLEILRDIIKYVPSDKIDNPTKILALKKRIFF